MSLYTELNNLIDSHPNKAFSACKNKHCSVCREIKRVVAEIEKTTNDRKQEKIQRILAKGQDMTKSDLMTLRENGIASKEIRKAMNMKYSQYCELIKDWGITRKYKGDEKVTKLKMTVEEFVSLREEGKTLAEIAKLKGVALPTIKNWKSKNKEAIQQALGQPTTKTEGETAKLIKKVVEPAGERKYEVLEAAVKQLENEKAAWQKRAEKAEKELSQRDDDKEAMRQANIQLANDNKEYREEIDNLTKARITAESELDRVSEEYTKSAEALRMARDEGALAQKRLEQQDYELENLRHSLKTTRTSLETLTKENEYLKGLVRLWA